MIVVFRDAIYPAEIIVGSNVIDTLSGEACEVIEAPRHIILYPFGITHAADISRKKVTKAVIPK